MYSSGEISSRMKSAIIIVVFVSLFRWDSASAGLTVIPLDTEAKINHSTYLNCSTNLLSKEIHWSHDSLDVYAGGSFYDPYLGRFQIEINNSTGAYNLVIPFVEPGDAGKYSCQDDGGFGQHSSTQLIVLADDPLCYSNVNRDGLIGPNSCGIEPDELRLSCSVTFHGNNPPQMEWRKAGENDSLENVTSVTSGDNVTYVLSLKTDLSMNNQAYVCQTTNSATSQYQCKTEVIKVQYGFSSVYTVNVTVGEEVNCSSANSSQPCSYKWKWFKGEDTTTESNKQTLKPTKIGSHRCEASCALGKTSCTIVVMHAEVYATKAATIVFVVVPVFLIVTIVVLAVVYFIIRCRRKNRMQRPSESQRREQSQMPLISVANQQARITGQVPNEVVIENPEENLDRYLSDPTTYRTIKPEDLKTEGKGINGLTILDKELFVVCQGSLKVKVYDLVEFGLVRKLKLENLTDMKDIASCNREKFLYILNVQGSERPAEIVRVDPNGNVIKSWPATGNWGFLSVTTQSNVIFSSFWENKLVEFLPDENLPDQIHLSGILHPYRAIKLTNGNFLVSNGYRKDPFHRVCIVDGRGIIVKVSGEKIGSSITKMDHPVDVIVDEDGFVLVSDQHNKRVLLLDNNLQLRRELLTEEKHKIRDPWKILLDVSNGRLIVAENTYDPKNKVWRNGQLCIYNVKQISQ